VNQLLYWLAVALWVGMCLWPPVLLARAPRRRQYAGLVAAVCTCVVSLWRFGETPPGVCCMDVAENMHLFYREQNWAWLWLDERAHVSQGFGFFPVYVANLWLGNFYGERIFGFICHVLLVLGAAALLPSRGLYVGLALVAVSPTVLWRSRVYDGTHLLLPELGLIGALGTLRRKESGWATLVAGICLGFLSWVYMPARIMYAFPAIWLWRKPKRAIAVYGVLLLCLTPVILVPVCTGQPIRWALFPGHLKHASFRLPSLSYTAQSLRSLVDGHAGATASTSYRGTQTLPWIALPAIVSGSWRSPFGIAGLVALAPDVFSSDEPGRSGRQMFSFLPFAFAAARLPAVVAARPSVPVIMGILVAVECVARWIRLTSPTQSMIWKWPNGYSGLDPCNHVDPRPVWCRRSVPASDGGARTSP